MPLGTINLVLFCGIKVEDVFMFLQYPLRSLFDNFILNIEGLFHIEKRAVFSVL